MCMRVDWLRLGAGAGLSVLLSVGSAYAASFDCKLAKTPVEKAICASPALNKMDDAMAAKYKAVLAEVPADVQPEVRADQRAWLKKMAVRCKADDAMASCLMDHYKAQMEVLNERVMTKGGVRFVTRTIVVTSKDEANDSQGPTSGLEENPGAGTLHASWPQALNDSPEWVAWNAAVLRETQTMAGGNSKVVQPWSKDWAAGTEGDVTTTVDFVSSQFVSVSIAADEMGHGAAHPNEASEDFHWLLQETIEFAEYSVSPRSVPVDGVMVPWSVLRAYLKPGFMVPK
jgi:uncharacterized protein